MAQFTIYGYGSTYCGFCERAKLLLTMKKVDFEYFAIDNDPEKKQEMFARNPDAKTVPQIFEGETLIGGSDELFEYFKRKEN